ncbi:MAG: ferritin family protein [Bacillota bacterium]
MNYTAPGQPQGIPYYFTNKIREAMMGKLAAINGYAYHINSSDSHQINEVWKHIMEDEKRHFRMFLGLLRKYDPIQSSMMEEVKNHIKLEAEGINFSYSSKYTHELMLNHIRRDIRGEQESILLYEKYIAEIPYQEVIDVFKEIVKDEKKHVGELTLALLQFDKDCYEPMGEKKDASLYKEKTLRIGLLK